MIIKLTKVISCTSEDPQYPAANLLQQRSNSSWRCAKPGELLASVIFQFREPSCITGMDIGNYRSCIVVVTASMSAEPDNWIPIVNHQFLTHDEAVNGKFRDQVQLFTKKELNADTLKIKFDRVKVTCMQSANLREQFGLTFLVLRTEVVVDIGVDVFARFKLKQNTDSTVDDLKEKFLKQLPSKRANYKDDLAEKIKEEGASKFAKRQSELREPAKRPLLEKLQADAKAAEESSYKDDGTKSPIPCDRKNGVTPTAKVATTKTATPVARTPFGDVISSDTEKPNTKNGAGPSKKRSLFYDDSSDEEDAIKDKRDCSLCAKEDQNTVCKKCNLLPPPKAEKTPLPAEKKPKTVVKTTKPFPKLFGDVKFALSGYQNPQRDEIRRKALKMGGRYIADPNTTDNKCTHLICAYSKTPKSQLLKGHTKIVSHKFIEECFDKKTRLPWRRFALDKKEKTQPESEDEIEAGTSSAQPVDPYEDDTDSDSHF